MTSFTLKSIAIIAMFIDHTGAILFPSSFWMRAIGRLTMPIMCYCIGEGYRHTSDFKKYFSRLAIFALLSEIPFDIAIFWSMSNLSHQNVFFTLAIGLLGIYCMDKYKGFVGGALVLVLCFVADFMRTDYGSYGVLLVVLLYMCGKNKALIFAVLFGLTALMMGIGNVQIICIIAFIPIALYNGKQGPKMGKWFYAFYPLHLLLLAFLAQVVFV